MNYNDKCREEIYKDGKFLMCKILYDNEEIKKKLNVNLDDFGRVRTFYRKKFDDWNSDPIPIDIIEKKFNYKKLDKIDIQMLEVAKCNLHCWWCYLPDKIRRINNEYMRWFSPEELVDLFIRDNKECKSIYLSGGNPELVPDFIYSFMKELDKRDLAKDILLWSDDVLTTDYQFQMEKDKLDYMLKYNNYIKLCCLKGFDEESFAFNTLLDKNIFNEQLERLKKHIELGFDVYCYIILTCKSLDNIEQKINDLIKKLQDISYYLPLRVIPIKIEEFDAVTARLNEDRKQSMNNQYEVLKIWNKVINSIYTQEEINLNIYEIKI